DLCFGDDLAAEAGVRLVSFDRPGYGRSTPTSFSLSSIARDAVAVADALGIERFATLGQSGGGPFALATATVAPDRVARVGVASGPGPFTDVPGAVDQLDDNDTAANALLPDDPVRAAAGFARGFEPLVEAMRTGTDEQIAAIFDELMSPHDQEVLAEPRFAAALVTSEREALRQGGSGGGWDNVAWIGPWDVDISRVRCPVHLWYGDDDRFAPRAHGEWLRDHLPDAELT